jgi:hypothetical protein
MAQQASPNVIGHKEPALPQLTTSFTMGLPFTVLIRGLFLTASAMPSRVVNSIVSSNGFFAAFMVWTQFKIAGRAGLLKAYFLL